MPPGPNPMIRCSKTVASSALSAMGTEDISMWSATRSERCWPVWGPVGMRGFGWVNRSSPVSRCGHPWIRRGEFRKEPIGGRLCYAFHWMHPAWWNRAHLFPTDPSPGTSTNVGTCCPIRIISAGHRYCWRNPTFTKASTSHLSCSLTDQASSLAKATLYRCLLSSISTSTIGMISKATIFPWKSI